MVLTETSKIMGHPKYWKRECVYLFLTILLISLIFEMTTSAQHQLEKRIITVLVILFAMSLNLVVKSAEVGCWGPVDIQQPLSESSWITWPWIYWCVNADGSSRILRHVIRAQLSFKPGMSRSMVWRMKKVTAKFCLKVFRSRLSKVYTLKDKVVFKQHLWLGLPQNLSGITSILTVGWVVFWDFAKKVSKGRREVTWFKTRFKHRWRKYVPYGS